MSPQIATPAAPLTGYNKVYVKAGDGLYILNSSGLEQPIGSNPVVSTPGIYSSIPRWAAGASSAPVSGVLALVPVWLPSGFVVGHIVFGTANTAGVTMTHQWAGLYDSSYNQLAVTADATSGAIAVNTKFSWAIATIASGASTTFTTTYAGTHFLGIMIAASTMPALSSAFGTINPFMADTPAFGSSDTAQTTPPGFPHTAATPTNVSGNAKFYYMAATT
jgi:hypothetical protein